MNKYNNIKYKNTSMISEKLITRICNYIIAVVILMLLGLFYKKGPVHGFPIPWLINMRHILYRFMITSIIINTAIVVGCDLLTGFIIRIKEPKLKVNTRDPSDMNTYSETIEMPDSLPNERESVQEPSIDEDMIKKAEGKLIKPLQKQGSRQTKSESKNGTPLVAILVIASIVLSLGFSLFEGSTEDETDTEWGPGDGEIVLDADGELNTVADVAGDETERLFEALRGMDYEYFEEFGTETETESLLESTDWEYAEFDEMDSIEDANENYSLRRFSLSDSDGNKYMMAAYMDIGHSEEAGYECTMSGVAVISEEDLEYGLDRISDKTQLSNDDYEKYFMDNIKNVGTVSLHEIHILFWDNDLQNLTGINV